MNICMLTSANFPPEEGIGNYVYGLSKELIKKGHSVTIITRYPWKKTRKDIYENTELIRASFFPFYPFYMNIHRMFVNEIFKTIESDIDIVHIHSPLAPLIKTKCPIIATIHTPMLTDTHSRFVEKRSTFGMSEFLMGKFISYPLEVKLLNQADIITAVANSVASELDSYGIDPNKVEVVGNGIDKDIFYPLKEKRNDKYILYTGRLDYRKGLFDLIECARYICKDYSDVSFLIVGKGILLDNLRRRVDKLDLKERVRFLGFVDKETLIQLYQNATIYVLPSHYEGLPTVLLEAMSCGLSVVATSVSGNLDVINNGENGILVPPKSPKKMADAISLLLNNADMRERLQRNARKTIEEKYSWEVISNKYLKYYESLLNDVVI